MIKRKIFRVQELGPDGLDIPYFEITGNGDGPKLTIFSGIHGAEYTSIAATKQFVREIEITSLVGHITVIPIVNLYAFWKRTPFVLPVDEKNLNRAFPGNPDGTFTEIYAHHLFQKFILSSDFMLDMHAGDIPESLEPFTIFEESSVENESLRMARSFGLPHIIRQSKELLVVAGSTSASASAEGIPAIIAESGGNGILNHDAVQIHLMGLRNLCKELGVIEGKPWEPCHSILHPGWNWLRSDRMGWWQPMHNTGKIVKSGELLGIIKNLWEEVELEVNAPEDGTILFQTSSPAVIENGILIGLARN